MKDVTARHLKKLHAILARTEALENELRDNEVRERVHAAKNELLRALSVAEAKAGVDTPGARAAVQRERDRP